MPVTPTPLAAGARTEWIETGPAVLFLYGADGAALVEYTTEQGANPQWVCSEQVAIGRAYPLDATAGGCRLRITNQSAADAAFALTEDPRR